MLAEDDLRMLRAEQVANMPERCTIERQNWSPEGAGGQSDAWNLVTANVPCRVRSSGKDARARALAERLGVAVAYVVTLPYGTDVQEMDRLTINNHQRMQVLGAPVESFATARFCECIEDK